MKTVLVLDFKTWRCGGFGANRLGEGMTLMCNKEGFMCCLGQITPQVSEITKQQLCSELLPTPSDVADFFKEEIPFLSSRDGRQTGLASAAIGINDNYYTTPDEKIVLLKELFAKENIEIEVINHE